MSDEPLDNGHATLSHATGRCANTASLRVPTWLPVAAIHGTGSLLVGPHPQGAQAIIPPAVLARTPRGSDRDYDQGGWRLAVWGFAADGARVDATRPHSLRTTGFDEAAFTIRFEAPAHLPWLQGEAIERVFALRVLLRHGDLGAARLRELHAELDDLLIDASRHFGESWLRREIADI